MHILPKDTCDRLVVPLLVWAPVAFLLVVGDQAAKPNNGVPLKLLAIVTAVLAVPFVIGVFVKISQEIRRRS